MKFKEPGRERRRQPKAVELLGKPEEEEVVEFRLNDFFSAKEWAELVPVLSKFDYDEDEVADFEARNYLDAALALRVLDQEKFEELRNNTVAKRMLKGYLRDTDYEQQPPDWSSLNAVAVWLWPDLEQVQEIKDQVLKFKRSAEKQKGKTTADYLHAAEMVFMYPEMREKFEITEQWVADMEHALNLEEGNAATSSDLRHHWLRRDLTKALLFPPELFLQEPLAKTRGWIKKGVEYNKRPDQYETMLGDDLLTVAWLRLLMRQDVSYSNDAIQVVDRKPFGKSSELPPRSEV